MKSILNHLLIALALVSLQLGSANAAVQGATVLDDKQLANVRGGYCFLEECEDPPGSGNCQPILPSSVCTFTICVYLDYQEGSVEVYSCGHLGLSSCTGSTTYRQCVLAFTTGTCSYGSSSPCGVNVDPDCFPNKTNRNCDCVINTTSSTCDWTDCVNGS